MRRASRWLSSVLAPARPELSPAAQLQHELLVLELTVLCVVSLCGAAFAWTRAHPHGTLVAALAAAWPALLLLGLRWGLDQLWASLLALAAAPVVAAARYTLGEVLDVVALTWLLAPVVGLASSPSLPRTLGALADRLLPTRGEAGSLERLRSQAMVVTLVLSSFAALTTAPSYWMLGLPWSAVMTFGFGLLLLGLVVLYRRGLSAKATWRSLLALTFMAITAATVVEQPLEYASLLFGLVFPVSGFLLVGERDGIIGAIAAVAMTLLTPVLHAQFDLHVQAPLTPMVMVVRAVALIIGLALFTGAAERLRTQALAESERARKARGLFLANISHELRTPMNGVLGLTELLLQSEPTTEQREHLELIARSGQSLLTIISDVLNLTSLESGAMTLELKDVSPLEIARDVVHLLEPGARTRGLTLTMTGEPPARVHTDPTRLRQILSNLIGNALKFTDAGGVVVTLSPAKEGRFQVRVEDTGVGVPEAGRAKLFTPFHQADESSTRRHGGTGLGLALSRQLARAMGGELTYAPLPKGSVFTLELPVS